MLYGCVKISIFATALHTFTFMLRKIITLTLIMVSLGAAADDSLKGKTIAIFGDSYVRNHKDAWSNAWHSRAAERLGMFQLNYGRNGSAISFDRTAEGFGPAMTERYKELPEHLDYLLIVAGHNDADRLAQTDGREWPQFCAALDTLLTGVRARYPEARIGYVTPWGVDRPYFREVTDEIHAACARHGIPVLDMTSPDVVDVNSPDFRAKYFQRPDDTAHLNARGHALLIDRGVEFISGL